MQREESVETREVESGAREKSLSSSLVVERLPRCRSVEPTMRKSRTESINRIPGSAGNPSTPAPSSGPKPRVLLPAAARAIPLQASPAAQTPLDACSDSDDHTEESCSSRSLDPPLSSNTTPHLRPPQHPRTPPISNTRSKGA